MFPTCSSERRRLPQAAVTHFEPSSTASPLWDTGPYSDFFGAAREDWYGAGINHAKIVRKMCGTGAVQLAVGYGLKSKTDLRNFEVALCRGSRLRISSQHGLFLSLNTGECHSFCVLVGPLL
jgi:hypothetical protein